MGNLKQNKSLFFMLFTSVAAVFTISSVLVLTSGRESTRLTAVRADTKRLEIPVSMDAEINNLYPDNVGSSAVYAKVGSFSGNNSVYRYLVYFDVSKIPSDREVKQATLYFDRISSNLDADNLYEIHPIIEPWEAMLISWNKQPLFSDELSVGITAKDGVTAFDVTKFISRLESQPHFGYLIKKSVERGDNGAVFAAAHFENEGKRKPFLVVEW